jgi:hypothetical protein
MPLLLVGPTRSGLRRRSGRGSNFGDGTDDLEVVSAADLVDHTYAPKTGEPHPWIAHAKIYDRNNRLRGELTFE